MSSPAVPTPSQIAQVTQAALQLLLTSPSVAVTPVAIRGKLGFSWLDSPDWLIPAIEAAFANMQAQGWGVASREPLRFVGTVAPAPTDPVPGPRPGDP